ncbi:MAG: alginate lyase family protein [Caldisericaceae bacterium]|nr:alginate lyase family protein [Caldisericaceae bacterium]
MKKHFSLIVLLGLSWLVSCQPSFDLKQIEKQRVLCQGRFALREIPITITAFSCPRSAGGLHDFYSEGDYWWPDPDNPDGPYIRRDGLSNPNNFIKHRQLLIRLSYHVPALTAAYVLTEEKRFAQSATDHLVAWFVDPETKMNPHMLYAQAIKGRVTGRGIGIIDAIHLVEVAQAVRVLESEKAIASDTLQAIKSWFAEFLNWITTHPYGIKERDNGNNHSTCWAMQVAAYARLVGDSSRLYFVRDFYKNTLLPDQMAPDGSFPKELKRTKPYGYSLFNLDAMTMVCLLASKNDDLWQFSLPDGRSIAKGLEFLFPYIKDKKRWPFAKDVMYFDQWPVRHVSLLFGGFKLKKKEYLEVWKTLPADPVEFEVLRNFFIRQPLLWLEYLKS